MIIVKREHYDSPESIVVKVAVEKGFAGSFGSEDWTQDSEQPW